jgi:hypothetical protein
LKEGALENENVARKSPKPARSKKPDYIAAIIINAIVLVIVNQILNWNTLSFLTQDFKQVLPIQNISLAVTIIFNAAFLFFDPDWFTSLLRMVLNSIGVAVLVRYLNVFPFDFSAYAFNWAMLFRVMTIIGIVGYGIAIIVEAFKFIGALVRRK